MAQLSLGTRTTGKRARSRGFSSEIVFALTVAAWVFYERHERVVVSCGTDGTHHRHSKHYVGDAVDIVKPSDDSKANTVVTELRAALGPDYQVVVETSHIHVEYDPADPLNAEGASV